MSIIFGVEVIIGTLRPTGMPQFGGIFAESLVDPSISRHLRKNFRKLGAKSFAGWRFLPIFGKRRICRRVEVCVGRETLGNFENLW